MHTNRFLVRDVVTISPSEDLVAAAKLMHKQHIGFLVVVDKHSGNRHPLGVLTDRDILIKSVAKELNPHDVKVSEAMTPRPLFTTEEEDLENLLARMHAAGVRRAPVVDSTGQLLGLVSFDDLLQIISGMMSDMAGSAKQQRSTEAKLRV